MALEAFTATIGTVAPTLGRAADPSAAVTALAAAIAAAVALAASSTTVAANIATLVADGASPTQGHVTTLNTNWGTFLTAKNAADAAVAALSTTAAAASVAADVSILFNTSNVVSRNKLNEAVSKLLPLIGGQGILT